MAEQAEDLRDQAPQPDKARILDDQPARNATATDSAQKKAYGPAKAGQDAHDTPGIYTRYVL
jgi:hypothetical protein